MAEQSLSGEKALGLILSVVLASLTTWGLHFWNPVPAAQFTALWVSWLIWWQFYVCIYLGVGMTEALKPEEIRTKAIGSAIVVGGTLLVVGLVQASSVNWPPVSVLSNYFPLHIAFVWLLLAQHLEAA